MINFKNLGWYGLYLSVFNILLSLGFILWFGLNLGIDFKGGMVFDITTSSSISEIRQVLDKDIKLDFNLQELNKNNFLIRIGSSDDANTDQVKAILANNLINLEYRYINSVGPKISSDLVYSSIYAILVSVFAILFYIWLRFEWQFSIGAILALIHDIIVTIGFVSLFGLQFNISSVAAFLLILGYSINDTIVIYSRIRENLGIFFDHSLSWIVNKSLNETMNRTTITSTTTATVLLSMVVFSSGSSLFDFCLTMLIGVIAGTFSSIFIAAPMLLVIDKLSNKFSDD